MKGESAISSWQLAVLLFLSRVMQFFLAAPQNEQPGALTAALLLPASVAVSALLLLPAYFLLRRHPDKGLLDIAGERWGGAGLVYPVAFFLFSLCVLIPTTCAFPWGMSLRHGLAPLCWRPCCLRYCLWGSAYGLRFNGSFFARLLMTDGKASFFYLST